MIKIKTKMENGITLIALIITIIILVILAAVSIRAAYNSGIIDYSINGTKRYQEEGKKEESVLSETEGIMESILGRIDELGNGDTENNDVPDLLKDYVLGAAVNGERPGKSLWDDLIDYDNYEFKPDENSITDADESVIYLNELWGDYKYPSQTLYYYIRYNNAGYRIVVDYNDDEDMAITTDVIKVYEPKGDEGQIVEYSVDGTVAGTADWLVLYDNGTSVDITPVELDNSWTYTLGSEDPEAVTALPSGTDIERTIWSYNNAVDTLNAYCEEEIVTNSTAYAVRSVGTGFGITDTNTKYISTFLANYPAGQEGDFNEVGKVGDMNAEQDVVRMSYFSSEENPHPYGYAATDSLYLLTSRRVNEDSTENEVFFHVRSVDGDRTCISRQLLRWHVGCRHYNFLR